MSSLNEDLEMEDISTESLLESNNNDESRSSSVRRKSSGVHSYPLHMAVKQGKIVEVRRLLEQEDILKQDWNGKTALHIAASYGNHKSACKMAELLLECRSKLTSSDEFVKRKMKLVNTRDNNLETALHIAAKSQNSKLVEMLIYGGADLNMKSTEGKEGLELVYAKVPVALKQIFDSGVEMYKKDQEQEHEDLRFELDFGLVIGYPPEPEVKKDEEDSNDAKMGLYYKETELLSYVLHASEPKRKQVITHPLVQVFLHLKWRKMRIMYWASVLFHVLWLVLYSYFAVDLYLKNCPFIVEINDDNDTQTKIQLREQFEWFSFQTHIRLIPVNETTQIECPSGSSLQPISCIIIFTSAVVFLKEVFEMFVTPRSNCTLYWKQPENGGQLVMIVLIALTIWPVLLENPVLHSYQYRIAAAGTFLSWILILIQIGKLPHLDLYVEILVKVMKSFGLFILTFSSVLIAFALSMSIMLPGNPEFSSLPLSLVKVLAMMNGEMEYSGIFHDEKEAVPFPVAGQLIFTAFIMMVAIILYNLLIGLTVSDIQGLESGAQVSRLTTQLNQIFVMESFAYSSRVQTLLKGLHCYDLLKRLLVCPYDVKTCIKDVQLKRKIGIKTIPSALREEIKELATENAEKLVTEVENSDISNAQLKKKLKAVMKEIIAQWDFIN